MSDAGDSQESGLVPTTCDELPSMRPLNPWAAAPSLMLVDWCGATTATRDAEGMLALLAS